MKTDRVRGHLDLVLLGVLADEPGHGYAVITALRERTQGVLDLPEGSVYPALHRLEDLGLLTSDWQPVGGRRRRVYRLTERGAAAAAAEQRDWRALVSAIDAALRPTAKPASRLAEGMA
jgi:PadR family transcriptional regulator PadR